MSKRAPDEGLIEIAVSEKSIFFRFGSYKISSILIEGQFPNYQKVIPESQKNLIILNRRELLDALKRVAYLSNKNPDVLFFPSRKTLSSSPPKKAISVPPGRNSACEYSGPEATSP